MYYFKLSKKEDDNKKEKRFLNHLSHSSYIDSDLSFIPQSVLMNPLNESIGHKRREGILMMRKSIEVFPVLKWRSVKMTQTTGIVYLRTIPIWKLLLFGKSEIVEDSNVEIIASISTIYITLLVLDTLYAQVVKANKTYSQTQLLGTIEGNNAFLRGVSITTGLNQAILNENAFTKTNTQSIYINDVIFFTLNSADISYIDMLNKKKIRKGVREYDIDKKQTTTAV